MKKEQSGNESSTTRNSTTIGAWKEGSKKEYWIESLCMPASV